VLPPNIRPTRRNQATSYTKDAKPVSAAPKSTGLRFGRSSTSMSWSGSKESVASSELRLNISAPRPKSPFAAAAPKVVSRTPSSGSTQNPATAMPKTAPKVFTP
jgi:hypothetical protein